MASLGIVILWSGYTLGIFGLSRIKSAYGSVPNLTISDLALPSHRATYLAAVKAWSTATTDPAVPGPIPGSPASTPGGQVNSAISTAQKQVAITCTKGNPGYDPAACAYWKASLASLQAKGFGSP